MCKLSVIMSTYREPEQYVRLAVDSILNQTFTDFEFIIVIDDPNNAAMEALLNEYHLSDPRVAVLKNEKNLGLVGALNRALSVAHGTYVARMDSDDIATPDRFEKEFHYLQEHRLDIVGSLVHRMDENNVLLPGLDSRHYSPQVVMDSLMVAACVPHPSWLLKREVYDALGGYREMPRCEDYDFLLRALKAGYRIGLCDDFLLNYRISTGGISQTGLLRQHLAAKYLSRNYKRLEQVDESEICQNVFDRLSDGAARRYRKADALFLKARRFGKKRPIQCLACLIASLCISKHQRSRFRDMLKLRKIRKQDA